MPSPSSVSFEPRGLPYIEVLLGFPPFTTSLIPCFVSLPFGPRALSAHSLLVPLVISDSKSQAEAQVRVRKRKGEFMAVEYYSGHTGFYHTLALYSVHSSKHSRVEKDVASYQQCCFLLPLVMRNSA
ncbi:hypothetical protein PV326_001365 [Microctonus aethiopoides]|nr:hypothetical protein PV326_001365 [Microctonus aethiopoides]